MDEAVEKVQGIEPHGMGVRQDDESLRQPSLAVHARLPGTASPAL